MMEKSYWNGKYLVTILKKCEKMRKEWYHFNHQLKEKGILQSTVPAKMSVLMQLLVLVQLYLFALFLDLVQCFFSKITTDLVINPIEDMV